MVVRGTDNPRFAHHASGATLASSDDDINTVPSRYTFENTATSTLSSIDLDYSKYSKLGGGHHDTTSSTTTSDLVTVEEQKIEVSTVRRGPDTSAGAAAAESVSSGKKMLLPKFNMFRASPTKQMMMKLTNDDEHEDEHDKNAHVQPGGKPSSPPSWRAAATSILPTFSDDKSADSPDNQVRRYKNDGSRLEQKLERLDRQNDDGDPMRSSRDHHHHPMHPDPSLATVSLGDQFTASTGMHSALYSDYSNGSKDEYSLQAAADESMNFETGGRGDRTTRTLSSNESATAASSYNMVSSVQAEVDAESKQASLDYHALSTAQQQRSAVSPAPQPSRFFQPVVRSMNDTDSSSDDVRTISRDEEGLSSSVEDIPSLDAEYGSGLSEPTLPPPMPTMSQRLFGGGIPTPVIKSFPPLKASPTNSTGATTSDDDENVAAAHRAVAEQLPSSATSTPIRRGGKQQRFSNIRDILRDPNSQPHDLSDGEGSRNLPDDPSLEGKSFEFLMLNNNHHHNPDDDDDDNHPSSIASITNAMERGRTMAVQAPGLSNDKDDEEKKDGGRRSLGKASVCLALVCLIFLLILGGLIAGVCGSGYCSTSKWQSSRPSVDSSSELQEDDVLYNLPPDYFDGSGRSSLRPTVSPAGSLPTTMGGTNGGLTPTVPQPVGAPTSPPIVLVPIWTPTSFQVGPQPIPQIAPGETSPAGASVPSSLMVLSSPTELHQAVDNYVLGAMLAPISEWDVSRITDFSQTFSIFRNPAMRSFNADLSGWDTSNAVSMRQMFHGASSFNGDVSNFVTSNVQDMQEMFANAEAFNGDLSKWDTGRVTTMRGLFQGAFNFNGDIRAWDTSQVTDMANMFLNAASFNQMIGTWSTGNVVSMASMFRSAPTFNQNLQWDTSKVVDMDAMFMAASSFDGNVPFSTSSVTVMNRMFYFAGSFTGKGIESWDTRKVTNMDRMFTGARAFVGDVTNWDMSSVDVAENLFAGAHLFSRNLCAWQADFASEPTLVSSVNMFANTLCPRQEDPTSENAFSTLCFPCDGAPPPQPAVPTPLSAGHSGQSFSETNELKAAVDAYLEDSSPTNPVAQLYGYPIGNWQVGRISDFSNLFSINRNVDAVRFDESLENWDMSSATKTTSMFEGAISFTGQGLSSWDTSQVTDMSRMFAYSGIDQNLSGWNVGNVQDFDRMFMFAHAFQSDLASWDVGSAEDMSWMFRGALQFSADLSGWDVQGVQTFEKMFAGARNFSANLCSWAQSSTGALTTAMFPGSACPSTIDPTGSSSWCNVCT